MKKWSCLLGLMLGFMLCPIPVQADVVFEPIGGEAGSLFIFAAVLAVIILLVTGILLIILKKRGKSKKSDDDIVC